MRRWAHRADAGLAGYLLWGGWFVVTAVVFSYMSGIIHSYYAVALAPAIAALVGAGLVDLWSARARIWLGGIAVGLLCLGSAWFGSTLLDRTRASPPVSGRRQYCSRPSPCSCWWLRRCPRSPRARP